MVGKRRGYHKIKHLWNIDEKLLKIYFLTIVQESSLRKCPKRNLMNYLIIADCQRTKFAVKEFFFDVIPILFLNFGLVKVSPVRVIGYVVMLWPKLDLSN